MTETTGPFRRLFRRSATTDAGRGRHAPAARSTDRLAGDGASIAVDIPDSDPLLAYLQSAPGPVDVARLELDSPAVDGAARRRGRAGRAAGVAGRADRHAEPRAAPVGAGLLDRRSPAADHAGRPGRPRHPRRPARPRAGRRGGRPRAPRPGAARRDAHPAAVPAARAAPAAASGRSPRSTARPGRSAATSTTSSRCPTAGSGSPSAT